MYLRACNNRYSVLDVLSDESSVSSSSSPISIAPLVEKDFSPKTPLPLHIHSFKPTHSFNINVGLSTLDTHQKFDVDALLDCGASGLFIDSTFVKLHKLSTQTLPRPLPVWNVNGTMNEGGSIREVVDLLFSFQRHKERATFLVSSLGNSQIIVGLPWLKLHNPDIDWVKQTINMTCCPHSCGHRIAALRKEKARLNRPFPSLPDNDETEPLFEKDWYYPGMEIHMSWFEDEYEEIPSYKRIFYSNAENDQILEFEFNRLKSE